MRRKLKLTCFLFVLAFPLVLIPAQAGASQVPDHEKAEVTSRVVEVIDGGTIELANGMNVRYLGLDTLETHHPEKPVEYFGIRTSKFNQKLVGGRRLSWSTT